jgi:hypothetical protein
VRPGTKKEDNMSIIDKQNRILVHERWVIECINKKILIEKFEMFHLFPLPVKIPIFNANGYTLVISATSSA